MEHLSQEELEQLLARGRIQESDRQKRANSSKRKRVPKTRSTIEIKKNRKKNEVAKSEPDDEWLKAEIEKAERSIAKPEHDSAQSEQRHEAAKF
jgi:hypothetical protein